MGVCWDQDLDQGLTIKKNIYIVNESFTIQGYGKLYGPTVRHFDEEAARKYITAALCNFVADKEGEKGVGCPRCGARVYKNEEVRTSGGRAYHRGCAKCATCARQLDLTSIYEGADKDLYCKGCYGRKFGTAGFRGIISKYD